MKRHRAPFRSIACVLIALWAPFAASATTDADAVALRAAVATERARPVAPRFPRATFLVQATVDAVALSPDGTRIAWFERRGDIRGVWTMATRAGAKPQQLLGQTDATSLAWTRDGRWLLLEAPTQLFALAAAGHGGSGIVTTLGSVHDRQLLAVDTTRPAATLLLEHDRARNTRPERWRVLRSDMQGHTRVLRESANQIVAVALAPDGRLAWVEQVDGDMLRIDHVDAAGHARPVLRCTDLHRCDPLLRTDRDGNLLLMTDIDGSLRHLVRLTADGKLHTLAVDPHDVADLDSLALDPITGTPRIASYRSTVATNVALDATTNIALTTLTTQLPSRNLDVQLAHGADTPWLVSEQASTLQPTRWHLYDPRNGSIRDILERAPQDGRNAQPARWIPSSALARKLPVSWTANDGMRLYGFAWLPLGRDPATLPLVAMVHGGPWNHARAGEFGAGYSQFLANRGYIVFEPNFRSSTGYGRDYVLAAHGDFGNGRVQQDIVEGVHYLLSQGIGDANRVGIVGASFGGYSTLLGVTFQPELFKVGVAIVPPPDFGWDLRWIARNSEALNLSRYIPFNDWLRMLSLDLDDKAAMARLHAQSPLANADRMNRPLLIFASGKDRRVALRGVLGYAAKLKLLGKDVSLFVDDQAGHKNYTPLSNEAYLYLLALMLHDHLGGAAPTPPDPELRDYLHHNLRIAGSDLQRQ